MSADPGRLPPVDQKTGLINAVIETPRQSRVKTDFDPGLGFYKVHDVLPEGFTFPCNFGFVPGRLAGDGEPLDVLVITNAKIPCGVLETTG